MCNLSASQGISCLLINTGRHTRAFCLANCRQQSLCLQTHLIILIAGIRLNNNGTTSPYLDAVIAEDCCANDDVQVKSAIERDEAQRARIDAACLTLQSAVVQWQVVISVKILVQYWAASQ